MGPGVNFTLYKQKCFVKLFYACSLAMQFFEKRILVQKLLVMCWQNWLLQVSISKTFYTRLFHTKVFCAAFLQLQFDFVIFWCKNFSAKGMCKMLVKLSTGVKARQKKRNSERDREKELRRTMCVICVQGSISSTFQEQLLLT